MTHGWLEDRLGPFRTRGCLVRRYDIGHVCVHVASLVCAWWQVTVFSAKDRWLSSSCAREEGNRSGGVLVVQNDIQEGAMHMQLTVVINETHFPELVHEKTHTRACGTDHFGECF